jgi:predicted lipid-binding transport protein (Tim44 family)
MKRFAMLLTIMLTCVSLLATTAEARRFGGGSSFGKQRSVPMQQQRAPEAAPRPATPPPAQQGNRWLGPLAGLAIGAGLGALFSHGLGGPLGSILLVIIAAGLVLYLISRLSKPKPAAMQPANNVPFSRDETAQRPIYNGAGFGATPTVVGTIPSDFPVESFIRNAKTSFIRLQAANDRKDIDDIREYTTPEMFAEISMQMHERGDSVQHTDVLSLDASLLEAVTEGDFMIASVRFIAQLSENKGAPEQVDEIWHVQRDLRKDNSTWLLAGIQQTSFQ